MCFPCVAAVVAEARLVAAGVSAGPPSVAPPPGSAAPGLPAAPHGRRQQLLPVQQLRPILQHHAPIRRTTAYIGNLLWMAQDKYLISLSKATYGPRLM